MLNRRLATFDPEREFIVRRAGLRASGHVYAKGETFRSKTVPERTLRQLFEQAAIQYPDEALVRKPMIEAKPEGDAPKKLSKEERIQALMDTHTKTTLQKMCDEADPPIKYDRSANKGVLADLIVASDGDLMSVPDEADGGS